MILVIAHFCGWGKNKTKQKNICKLTSEKSLTFYSSWFMHCDLCSEFLSNAHGVFTVQNLNVRKIYDVRV